MNEINIDRSEVSERISNRNNLAKIVLVIIFSLTLVYKIIFSDLSGLFSGFNFSDLLSLFLALFSVGLAVVFYFKATETANEFYNNTYKFTRDVSEILGRVEAGFGEKLSHLDEGYSGLKSAVERLPYDRVEAERRIQEEEAEVNEAEKVRDMIFNTLAERAKLDQKEKEKLFEQLKEQEIKLGKANAEIIQMKSKLLESSENEIGKLKEGDDSGFISFFENFVRDNLNVDSSNLKIPRILNKNFRSAILDDGVPEFFIDDLKRYRIVDERKNLTPRGVRYVKDIIREGE